MVFSKGDVSGYKFDPDNYVPFDESQHVSPRVAGLMFGVGSDTIKSWERRGRLRAVRTRGGHRRYAIAELNALMGECTTSGDGNTEKGA